MSPFTRRISRISTLILAAALVFVGCGNDAADTFAEPMEAGDVEKVAGITVTGQPGYEPILEFPTPFEVTNPTTRLISDGPGAPIQYGQMVTYNAAAFRGDTGELIFSTWADHTPESIMMGTAQASLLTDLLAGANVGARGIIANPVVFWGEEITAISIFEVISAVTVPTRAEGEPVEPADGLPIVTLDASGEPSIEFPEDWEPSENLVVQTLIRGDGPEVTIDDTLRVHYTGWLTDGTVFDSSWARQEPASFPLLGVIPGWQEGLAGQTVGSQVLLIIPPDLAYGDEDRGSIPGGSTLIFVVDILAAF